MSRLERTVEKAIPGRLLPYIRTPHHKLKAGMPKLLHLGDRLGIIGPDAIYSESYYEKRRHDPWRSDAHASAAVLDELFSPESVVDYGCAIGAFLEPFHEDGRDVLGIEGSEKAFDHAVIPRENLVHADLRDGFDPGRTFGLVLSIEVAEHIPEKFVDTYLDTLARSGDRVVMTAATLGQDGTHHVNLQPRDYWIGKMDERGFDYDRGAVDTIREGLSLEEMDWIPENVMVFERD